MVNCKVDEVVGHAYLAVDLMALDRFSYHQLKLAVGFLA
jgi:hypothetical protein